MKNISNDLPEVINELIEHLMNDIWNADEFGLCNIIQPNSTIGPAIIPSKTKEKERLMNLSYANTGRSENIQCLKLVDRRSLNASVIEMDRKWALTITVIKKHDEYRTFLEWLKSLDDYILAKKDRSVALLLDLASFPGSEGNLPILRDLSVSFLPANTT